jgi:hypothetical protein
MLIPHGSDRAAAGAKALRQSRASPNGRAGQRHQGYSCAEKTASPADEMHEFMAFFALTLFQESCLCGFPFETGEVECNPQEWVERIWRIWTIQEFLKHLRVKVRRARTCAETPR